MGNTPTPLRETVRADDVNRAERMLSNKTSESRAKLINEDYSPDCILDSCKRVDGNALYYAVERNRVKMVELFLKHGGDIHSLGRYDETLLHCCGRVHGNVKLAKILIEHGADLKATDDLGRYPIHSASSSGFFNKTPFIEYLLSTMNEADARDYLNIKDFYGNTPLMTAVNAENIPVTQSLQLLGADDTIVNNNGQTAFDIAKERKAEMMEILESKQRLTDNSN
ncbi:unnamed protein product [Owenia fusiformis]|uniref:Uncharacterized protein n=1 Tax=Owenia fusiformis TaxID=6347 RepID=A0A8J1XTR7_OWEFU|nr:unnamed protein product [Owenia fusiformis]